MSDPLRIELSWPAKELSPNGRAHPMVVWRFKKAAKIEANWATRIVLPIGWAPEKEPIAIHLIAHPPEAWRTGDPDNLVSRCKAFLDGISEALGINDRSFDAPTVEWANRCQYGKLFIVVGNAPCTAEIVGMARE